MTFPSPILYKPPDYTVIYQCTIVISKRNIVLSGVVGANTEILTEAINKGTIDCFFEKPLNLEYLMNRLDKEIELAELRKMNPNSRLLL